MERRRRSRPRTEGAGVLILLYATLRDTLGRPAPFNSKGSVPRSKRRRYPRLLLPSLFLRMFVGRLRMLVCELVMFVSRVGVLLPLFVLAEIVMMGGLMMMMGGCVVMSRRLMMMLTGRMLWGFCHWPFLPTSP
jgi:hypothetical protein